MTRVMLSAMRGTSASVCDLRVDRQQIVVAADGDAEAGEIDGHRGAGRRSGDLGDEGLILLSEIGSFEVVQLGDVEAGAGERLGDQRRVGAGGRQGVAVVGGLADDQGQAGWRAARLGRPPRSPSGGGPKRNRHRPHRIARA